MTPFRGRLALTFVLGFLACGVQAQTPQNWWNPLWRYRVPVEVNVGSFARSNKPVNVDLNFTQLLGTVGGGTMNDVSLRVVEVTVGGAVLNAGVPLQFDREAAYDAASNARGTLVFLLEGNTPANATRYFQVYFDTAGGFSPAAVAAQVAITDNVFHEGQDSFRIATPAGTYYYHKEGAGFASLDDVNGNDWIGYHPGLGPAGEFRGIPNMGAVGHPGDLTSSSTIVSQGPLKATVQSQSLDGNWRFMWEFYPNYATMTLQQAGGNYFLLYEGTPGGTFEPDSDSWTRSSGETLLCNQTWVGDVASPEWVYFRDGTLDRYLFMAHHEDDSHPDQYWELAGDMTVFGFGRQYPVGDWYLTAVPAHLTIGLGDGTATAPAAINSAFRDLNVFTGAVNVYQQTNGSITLNVVGNGTVVKNPEQPTYALNQVVTLTAVPGSGADFAGWSGTVNGIANPVNLTVLGGHLVTATFTNHQAPQIITQPLDVTAFAPNAASFSVTAAGTAPMAYQWRRGGVNIEGATSSSYTLSPTSVAADHGAQFSVVVTNASGSVTSAVATLAVIAPGSLPAAGLALWLRGEAGTVLNGSAVAQWSDQSGNNRHATQGTGACQPAREISAVNGVNDMPVVRFDGDSDFLTFNLPIQGLGGMSIFLVAANTQDQDGGQDYGERQALFWNETAPWGTVSLSPFQSSVDLLFGTTQADNRISYARPASVGSTFTMTEAIKNGATDALYVNGALVVSEGGKLPTIAGCRDTGNVGRGFDDSTYFAGDIAEVLVYDRALSQVERQAVEAYLNNKYFVIRPMAPQITNQPSSISVAEPAAAGFSVSAKGTAPLSYQWRRGGVDIAGATSSSYTLSPTSVASDNGAQFSVVVTNGWGSVTSSVGTLLVSALPPGAIFYDDFTRPVGADLLTPWEVGLSDGVALGTWTVTNGMMLGASAPASVGFAYYSNNWTDYSVEVRASMPTNAYGWTVGGRLDPVNGKRYGVFLLPYGSAVEGKPYTWVLRLVKYTGWDSWSGTAMSPDVGVGGPDTDSHTLKMTFEGNRVQVDFDGVNKFDVIDNNFEGPPFSSGGIAVGLYTSATNNYSLRVEDVIVRPLGPVATGQVVVTPEDTATNLLLMGSVVSGTKTFALGAAPAHGSLSGFNATSGTVTYTPAADYSGPDSFTFTVSDGTTISAPGLVSITVAPPVLVHLAIAGTVRYYPTNYPPSFPSTKTLTDAAINLTGDTNLNTLTLGDGSFGLTGVAGGGTYGVTPSKTIDSTPANGVTTLDIALIRQHILSPASSSLKMPYKLLAADVNNSSSVSTLDIALIRQVILGGATQFPVGLWRFVPADYVFPNTNAPWTAPNASWHTNLTTSLAARDFVAIKLGDVNDSWAMPAGLGSPAPGGGGVTAASLTPPIQLQIGHHVAQPGERVSVPIRVGDFTDVTSAQFTLAWDPNVLRYVGVEGYGLSGLSTGNFGVARTAEGKLAFSWNDQGTAGVTLADGTAIFTVSFAATGQGGSASALRLTDIPTVREVSVNLAVATMAAEAGEVRVVEANGLRLSEAAYHEGRFELTVSTELGRRYILEYSIRLPATDWTALPGVEGDGRVLVLSDTSATNHQRFYRVRIE